MSGKINQTAIWIFTLALIAWGGATADAQRTFEPRRSSGGDRKVEATKTEPNKTPTKQAPIRQSANASELRRHAGTMTADTQYLLDAAKKTRFSSPKVRDQVLRSLGELNEKSRSFAQQTTNRRGDLKNSSRSYSDTRKAFGSMQRHWRHLNMNNDLRERIARIEISLNYCGGYYDDYDDGYGDDDHFDPHYVGPDRHRIERLAHELENATDVLYKVTKHDIRHGAHGYSTKHSAKARRKTWAHVKDMETVGDSFNRLARDYNIDIYHIEKLYARAQKELHSIEHGVEYFGESVHHQFYEVERLMRRMGQALEGRRHSSIHIDQGRRLTQLR